MLQLVPERELIGFIVLGCWAGYIAYQLEYRRAPPWLYGYLVLKLLAGWSIAGLYYAYYRVGDTISSYLALERFWHYLTTEPRIGLALLMREFSPEFEAIGWRVYERDPDFFFYNYDLKEPVNYLFYRLLFPFYLASGRSYFGLHGLISLLSGLLWYGAYLRWRKLIQLKGLMAGVWFLLPSGLFWTSGLIRDSFGLPLTLYSAGWLAGRWRIGWGWGLLGWLAALALRWEGAILGALVGLMLRGKSGWGWRYSLSFIVGLVCLQLILPKLCAYRSHMLFRFLFWEGGGTHVLFIPCGTGFLEGIGAFFVALVHGLTGPYGGRSLLVLLAMAEIISLWLVWGRVLWRRRQAIRANPERWRFSYLILAGMAVIGIVTLAVPFWGAIVRQRLYGLYLIHLGFSGLLQGAQDGEGRFG